VKPLTILHVGLGPLGSLVARDFLKRRLGSIAAAADLDARIVGRPLAEVLDAGPDWGAGARGVKVSPSVESALAKLDPGSLSCAVVATSSSVRACLPTFRALLSRGISVVSTCEELLFPWHGDPAAARELEELCAAHGVKIVGTGVNPGFLMDTLPVALTAVVRSVRSVRVERYQDASNRRVPFQQKIGAGLDDAAFQRKVADGSLRHVGLGESLHFVDRYLELGVVKWNETLEPVRAARALECAIGPIRVGGISGVRQTASGYNRSGERVVHLDFQAAIGQADPRDRVVIEVDPPDAPIDATIRGGVHGDVATSAITLNAIPSLLAAGPGLHTMATLPVTKFARGRG
jgi:4-hydroxy-tetrahydrodipicolinate reductase